MEKKTFLISGIYRGGTTLTANILKAAGVPIGTNYGNKLEDLTLRRFFHQIKPGKVNESRLAEVVEDYNSRFGTWGFKYPFLHYHFETCFKAFRAPFFIFVTRCPWAVAKSEARYYDGEHNEKLVFKRTLDSYQKINSIIENFGRSINYKIVSFEYLITPGRSETEVEGLLSWAGLDGDAGKIVKNITLPKLETRPVISKYPIF